GAEGNPLVATGGEFEEIEQAVSAGIPTGQERREGLGRDRLERTVKRTPRPLVEEAPKVGQRVAALAQEIDRGAGQLEDEDALVHEILLPGEFPVKRFDPG